MFKLALSLVFFSTLVMVPSSFLLPLGRSAASASTSGMGFPGRSFLDCPEWCHPDGTVSTSGTTCADVTVEELTSTHGTAQNDCANTCTVCAAVVKLTWDCSGCNEEQCTWVWGNQSYDKEGTANPYEHGTGQGGGSVRQTVTTSCNGSEAVFGISIAGGLSVYSLKCTCP